MDGTPFGRYVLVDPLGRGGMGEVWRAFDTATERMVAIKVLPSNFADDETYQTRFRREAKAAAGLSDPHVVPIHDFGEIDGRLYVTMRLVEGQDLQAIIDRGPLRPDRAVRIVEQIAGALHAAHRIDLIHRDVKPHNILVSEDDFAYLIDFGIARAAGETSLTSAGSTIGTWAYMAPERFQTGLADARADIYALTVVLYQALTGELPFPAVSIEQVAMAHLTQPPPPPSAVRGDIPAAMNAVIATGMAKNPDQRYATTKDLATAARTALARPTPPPFQHVAPPAEPVTKAAPAIDARAMLPAANAASTRIPPNAPIHQPMPATAIAGLRAPHPSPADGSHKKLVIVFSSLVGASLALLVAFLFYAFAIRDSTTQYLDTSTTTSGTSSGETTTSTQQAGTTVTDGDATFSVARVETRDTVTSVNTDAQATASGEFIIVYLNVGNRGSTPLVFQAAWQELKAGGTSYLLDIEATIYLDGGQKQVNQGEELEIPIAFDVPVGTTPSSIQVHSQLDGTGAELPL